LGSGGLPSQNIWGKCLTKLAFKSTIGGEATPVASGITSMAPIDTQPGPGRLNGPESVFVGTVAMISGQRLSRQAAGISNHTTSLPLQH
jgi:hypothetical protein